ncbi:MAG: hypothetical protein FOGNACKC_06397 [Anaerolineae bacterium]|nr:hypothetical protein [Anaerolineae bacterium]
MILQVIPIANEIFRPVAPGGGFLQLLRDPDIARRTGYSQMDDPPAVVLDNDKNIDRPKEQIVGHGEITGPNLSGLIVET